MGLTKMDTLSTILDTFRLQVEIINNAQYCGDWAIDTSGSRQVSFHLVVHGDCVVTTESLDEPESLKAGDFVMFPHDAPHRLESNFACAAEVNQKNAIDYEQGLADDGVGLLCGYFRFTHLVNNPLIDVLPEILIKRSNHQKNGNSFSSLLDFIRAESLSPLAGSQAAINRSTESLFILILREFITESKQVTGLAAALANPKLSKALDAIHTQPEAKWSVDKLAKVANMSRSAFSEQFKKYLNESPIDYLTRWRMQIAWQWLQEEISVLEVAERCGYESEAAFAKAFKRVIGIGPGEARNKKTK